MQEWTASIGLEGLGDRTSAEDLLLGDRIMADLEPYDGVVSLGGDQLSATLTVDADSAAWAVNAGLDALTHALDNVAIREWRVTRLEIEPADAVEPPPGGPLPELAGMSEVAQILGVSKTRVRQLADEGRLPQPVLRLAATPVWLAEGVRAVAAEERRPGRPRAGV